MIRKFKSYILSAAAALIFLLPMTVASPALAVVCGGGTAVNPANTNQCLCTGSNFVFDGSAPCPDAQGGIGNLIRTIINILSAVIGAVAVIMIIIAGFRPGSNHCPLRTEQYI
jgi:hypothetical protein